MDPKVGMSVQAVLTVGFVFLLGLSPLWQASIIIAVVTLVWWLYLDVRYALALGNKERSRRRAGRDHIVTAQIAALCGVGLASGLAGRYAGIRLTQSPAWYLFEIAAAAVFLVMFLSSLIDWYYIRPRLDGVVCEPPCRTSMHHGWRRVTRVWFIHRAVALGLWCFAAAAALTFFVTAIIVTAGIGTIDESITVAITLFAAVIALIGYFVVGYRQAFTFAFMPVTYKIGDELYKGEEVVGYLRDVSAQGVVIVSRDDESSPWTIRRMPLEELNKSGFIARTFIGCQNGCCGVNRDSGQSPYDDPNHGNQCEWDPKRLAGGRRKRRIIVL